MKMNRSAVVLRVLFWLGLVVLVAGVGGIRAEMISVLHGFLLMAVGALVVTIFAVVSLVAALLALLRGGSVPGHRWMYVVVGALPLVVVFSTVGVSGFQAPGIHDITTDLDSPPQFTFAAVDRGPGDHPVTYYPDVNAEAQKKAFPELQPLTTSLPADRVLALAAEVMEESGWRVLGTDTVAGTVEGMYRSVIFGFEDDVVARVTPYETGSRVDVRSASRVGGGDLGANAARIKSFIKALDAKISQEMKDQG